MPRGRKPRVTKEEVIAYREEKKIPSYKRKKDIKPGPWSEIEAELKVHAQLRYSKHFIEKYGETCGTYKEDSKWDEKGWYPIAINIVIEENMQELVQKHGINQVMAACENSLNEIFNEEGKKKYGDIVLLSLMADNSQNQDLSKRFLSCHAKTNKKVIEGFMAIRSGEYTRL